jgi:hypothetical protein
MEYLVSRDGMAELFGRADQWHCCLMNGGGESAMWKISKSLYGFGAWICMNIG